MIDRYFDRDILDKSIYFFKKYALIITDYFSDNEIKNILPEKNIGIWYWRRWINLCSLKYKEPFYERNYRFFRSNKTKK